MKWEFKYVAVLIICIPVVLVALPFILAWMVLESLLLRVWFWLRHKASGRDVLLITSQSPIWSDYIRENILPRLGDRVFVMNWSERRFWRHDMPIAARAHRRWSGEKGKVPSIIIMHSFWNVENVSLYQAFRDYKHGKTATLKEAEDRLFSTLGT